MKKIIILAAILGTIICGSAFANTENNYSGVDNSSQNNFITDKSTAPKTTSGDIKFSANPNMDVNLGYDIPSLTMKDLNSDSSKFKPQTVRAGISYKF